MAHERHFRFFRSGRPRRTAALAATAALALGLLTVPPGTASDANAAPPTWGNRVVNVLVFHGPAAEQDDPVVKATNAIRKLGREHGFYVHEADDPAVFTADNLARYRSVVFLSANGVTLDQIRAKTEAEFSVAL